MNNEQQSGFLLRECLQIKKDMGSSLEFSTIGANAKFKT
jgi:hypothetical protein